MKKNCLIRTIWTLGMLAVMQSVWADMTPEEALTNGYWATVQVRPSTTTAGTGKVYASTSEMSIEEVSDWLPEASAEGYIESYLGFSDASDVAFYAYAKPDWGSYLAGWSYANGGADIYNTAEDREDRRKRLSMAVSKSRGIAKANHYVLYATFAPIRIVSYEIIEGSTITSSDGAGHRTCTQTVLFRAEAGETSGLSMSGDEAHFYVPTVVRKAGTSGTWTTIDTLISAGVDRNVVLAGSYAEITVPVTFTIDNDDPGDFAATLTLETKAGMKMSVPLVARTPGGSGEAIRYDKTQTEVQRGSLTEMIAAAGATDIIRLNNTISASVSINKDVVLDLNGYTLSNTLTVNGGKVTVAHSHFGGNIAGNVHVTGGQLTLAGGTITGNVQVQAGATLALNGALVEGNVTNAGTMSTTDGAVYGQLSSGGSLTLDGGTFHHEGGSAIRITGGTATIRRGSIDGGTYGVETTGGTTTIDKQASVTGSTKALNGAGGSLTVQNGKFTDPEELADGSVTFIAGYFQTNLSGASLALGQPVWRNTAGAEYREGYLFFVGSHAAARASNVSVCRINNTAYASLEDALAYANNNPETTVTILLENDYTLPAGYYTLPSNATLVVPRSNDQETANPVVEKETLDGSSSSSYDDFTPVSFRRLTLADGVHMSISGTLEVTAKQYCINGQPEMAVPGGPYGQLIMTPGSRITINAGGELRAWGYVTGDGSRTADGTYQAGEIDARRGAIVREQFQIGDWKGGSNASRLLNIRAYFHLFPIYEYFIQNVEVPVKYHPGSSLLCATSVAVAGASAYVNNIKIVGMNGESAMFLMDEMADAENTWVRKWYDANKDQQVYEVNSGAQLGSLFIDLGALPVPIYLDGVLVREISFNSADFILPLTNNMKIHLLSGSMEFTQSAVCLPGMEVEIDKESTISIVKNERPEVVSGGLYLYDADQWGQFIQHDRYGAVVRYSATLNGRPTVRDVSSAEAMGDARMLVHGTFRVAEDCAIYTTAALTTPIDKSSQQAAAQSLETMVPQPNTGGASIRSTNEDAGTFVFDGDVPAFDGVSVSTMHFGANALWAYHPGEGKAIPYNGQYLVDVNVCTAARLKNGEGAENAYAETEGQTAGTAYCYINNQWTSMTEDGCFMKDNYGVYYAKPAEYVALANGKTANEDHTYSDRAGTGRLFILMKDDCQWWEVEKKDNLYHCIHPNNDTYYYWDDVTKPSKPRWAEKKFTITWKDWNGTVIQTANEYGEMVDNYEVTYGTTAEFLGSTPTREPNIDYTYDFVGWAPVPGRVTSDVTYTAVYEQKERKYTIVFQSEGGVEIERQFLTHNEMPSCENTPVKTGYLLQWYPALAAVTGDATYTATWLAEPPTEYEIRFVDYDGVTELQKGNVPAGSMPVPPADPTGKPATSEYTYVFDRWSPALAPATQAITYTAVYKEAAQTYEIRYYKEDGVTLLTTQYLPYGATPTPPVVSKENPETGHTYTLVWKNLTETASIQTVVGDESYKPTYIDEINRYTRYTVVLSSTIPEGCTLIGAGTYDEGASVAIRAEMANGYAFDEWQETHNTNADLGTLTITGDIVLTAVVHKIIPQDLVVDVTDTETILPGQTVKNLVIKSDGMHSGQLVNAENLTVIEDAWFELAVSAQAGTEYMIAVPWLVSVADGIYADGAPWRAGTDGVIYYYDGARRAAEGQSSNCWTAVESDAALQPGKLYKMHWTHAVDTVRFKKQEGAALLTTSLNVVEHRSVTSLNAGWNGIANPALYHAYLNTNATTYTQVNFGQVYLPREERYEIVNMSDDEEGKLIVGAPVIVQVAANQQVNAYTSNPAHQTVQEGSAYYELQLSSGDSYTDRIYLHTLDTKAEGYAIGWDLAKAGVSTQVAQMWVARYNTELCVNTIAPTDSVATYPLGLFVPQEGMYRIRLLTDVPSDMKMRVARGNKVIWNFANGPYEMMLEAGTYTDYSIELVPLNAPDVPFDIENIPDENTRVYKMLKNGQVFIFRAGEQYTITGQKVK